MKLRIIVVLAVVLSCVGAWCQSLPNDSVKPASTSKGVTAPHAQEREATEAMKPYVPNFDDLDRRLTMVPVAHLCNAQGFRNGPSCGQITVIGAGSGAACCSPGEYCANTRDSSTHNPVCCAKDLQYCNGQGSCIPRGESCNPPHPGTVK
jgi:hypothetical protein